MLLKKNYRSNHSDDSRGRTAGRSKSQKKKEKITETNESPLKLMTKFCDDKPNYDHPNDSQFKSDTSPQKKVTTKGKETSDSYLEKMKDKRYFWYG
jgi:hypothetical protein